jgi:hypothetical protein
MGWKSVKKAKNINAPAKTPVEVPAVEPAAAENVVWEDR